MKYLLAVLLSSVLTAPAIAREIVGADVQQTSPATSCMKETVSININYNVRGKDFSDVKKKIEEMNAKVEEYAKQQKLSKFTLQSKNFNINASGSSYDGAGNPDNFQFNGNGNSSYNLENTEEATKFYEFLISQKIQASINSSMYNQGNCNNSMQGLIKSR